MNLTEIDNALTELANSGDPAFATAAQQVRELTTQALAGQMSKQELVEVLADMQRQLDIIQDMNQMAFKEKLNTVLNGIIILAGAV
ncbi:hypothetical protein UFOVP71_455 [uncultured Caudovirales phage]|uniref:Uncharacterized protein n=1 Tax=uncultured Caudovirales phage TaxID=2100421 RepID=A0A6J5TDA6_9CAUD|nr:hypothetical protein UFOVP71_455 [uncultured Caudovirales phage]